MHGPFRSPFNRSFLYAISDCIVLFAKKVATGLRIVFQSKDYIPPFMANFIGKSNINLIAERASEAIHSVYNEVDIQIQGIRQYAHEVFGEADISNTSNFLPEGSKQMEEILEPLVVASSLTIEDGVKLREEELEVVLVSNITSEGVVESATVGTSALHEFSDDDEIFFNPDCGSCLSDYHIFALSNSISSPSGGAITVWFNWRPYMKVPGERVYWYRGTSATPVGSSLVVESTHDWNIRINSSYEGGAPLAGDYFTNYFGDIKLYHTGMRWAELEPTKGTYNISGFLDQLTEKYCLSKGMKFVFRFIMDYPKSTGSEEMDIPQWLYDELVTEHGEAGAGYWYNHSWGAGFAPNYMSSILRARHKLAIQAIYDGIEEHVFQMQIGSIGHWGEFHNHPDTHETAGWFPTEAVQEEYCNHYLEAGFTSDRLSIRRNTNWARVNSVALYNDMIGNPLHAGGQWNEAYGMITDADNGYNDDYMTGRNNTHDPYPDWRVSGPIGGEHDPWWDDKPWQYDFDPVTPDPITSGRNYTLLKAISEDIEVSWNSTHPQFGLGDTGWNDFQDNVNAYMKILGYRFYVKQFQYTKSSTQLGLTLLIRNNGMARCYKDYPVYICFYDDQDEFISEVQLEEVELSTVSRYDEKTFNATINYPVNYEKIGIRVDGVKMAMSNKEIVEGVYEIGNISDVLTY